MRRAWNPRSGGLRRAAVVALALTALSPVGRAAAQSCWSAHPLDFPQPADFPSEFHAVIEIPAGGTVKYEIDPDTGVPVVDRFVVSPVAYPANYGFVAGTLEGDGDPLDVLIWTREPVVPGAVVRARAVGLLRMTDAGERDTKILAVPAADVDPRYADVRDIDDLGRWERERVESFFETYKGLPGGGRIELAGIGDAVEANAALVEAHDRCRQGA